MDGLSQILKEVPPELGWVLLAAWALRELMPFMKKYLQRQGPDTVKTTIETVTTEEPVKNTVGNSPTPRPSQPDMFRVPDLERWNAAMSALEAMGRGEYATKDDYKLVRKEVKEQGAKIDTMAEALNLLTGEFKGWREAQAK